MRMKIVFLGPWKARVPDTVGSKAEVGTGTTAGANRVRGEQAAAQQVAIKQDYTPMVKLYPV